MPVLAATNLKLAYGTRVILDGVSISVEPGQRIGVVGRNGCGKTSLLKILSGLMRPDGGTVSLQKGCRAGYLHQDPVLDLGETLRGAAESAFATLHDLHRQLDSVYEEMTTAQGEALDRLLARQARLEREMEAAGGYAIDHRIGAILHGLGFTDSQFSVPVSGLSGGQRGRLALAILLLQEPDVLLLDEPTNHLDLDGRLWLEGFLKEEYRGAVVMISHDRYLLDNVVTEIIEVEQGRLIDYPGNYEAFREIRAQRRLTQLRAYENQATQFKKEEAFIMRYKAGQRAKQARGRMWKLERAREESSLERPMEVSAFRLSLPKAPRSGDIVIAARGISKSYADESGVPRTLFRDLDVKISRGERWGIIGPNGSGKSTLVRTMLKEQPADDGSVSLGSNVVVGHFTQTHEGLDLDLPVYRYLQGVILKEAPGQAMSEQQARDLAGAFLFSGDEQERPLFQLSGGERARAVLAGLLASAKNLLVLDEPTNHLDIPSAERLEEALSPGEDGYDGTLILISHDRALIDATCDHLIVLDGKGSAEIFFGNYTEWHERELARRAERERRQAASREAAKARKPAPPPPKARPGSSGASKLARMTTEQLEARIAELEGRIREIDASLGDAEVWRDPGRCDALGKERAKLAAQLEPLEFEYFGRSEP